MSPCSAPGRRVSPRGEAPPRSPGRTAGRPARGSGAGSGPGGPRLRDLERGQAWTAAPASWAGGRGAGRREGKERRWEAPTPGHRRLPENFVVNSKASEKEKREPNPAPPARVSHAARRFCAPDRLLCAAPPPSLHVRAGGETPVARCWADLRARNSSGPPRKRPGVQIRTPWPSASYSAQGPGLDRVLVRTGLCSEPRALWGLGGGRLRHLQ